MSKLDRQKLPRVIAYCTASSYRMDDLFNHLQSRKATNGAAPKRFDECIYTPFSYTVTSKPPSTADLLGLDESTTNGSRHLQQQLKESTPELLFFDYGVVVIWGMSEQEESRLLQELSRFEDEKLDDEDVETEEFSFHYNSQFQPRIYNDVITLKSAGNYMVKLTISHAIAQSVKMTLFEGLIENTINATKNIPQTMAETGKVPMSRTAITKKIGQLFIMRINVNLVSNILDTPEIFWSEPSFQPLYSAIRGADNPPQKPIASTPSGTINRATRASVSRKSEVDVTELEQEEETTTITKTLSSLRVTSEASSAHRPVTRSLVGLNDRYKERVNARIRGAGVHQPDFRGFTIKPTKADKPKVDQAKEALVEIRDREPSRRASSRRQTTLQLRGPETSIPEITDTISRNDTSKPRPSVTSGSSDEAPVKKAPNVRPRPKARSAKTPSKVNEQPGPEKSRQEQNRAEDDFFRKTTAP
ncbi:hypothetical protein BGZ52_006648, partial [Haplosporangium bisporale]